MDFHKNTIIVGVTGHRDTIEKDEVKILNHISDFLVMLDKQYQPKSITLISALAEGADRIAAKAVIANQLPLDVVLPFEATEYEKDFTDQHSIIEFRNLVKQASTCKVIENQADRIQHYVQVGRTINKRSDILLALWDGNREGVKPGGTADVVKERLTDTPSGLVYHIKTPRQSNLMVDNPYTCLWINEW